MATIIARNAARRTSPDCDGGGRLGRAPSERIEVRRSRGAYSDAFGALDLDALAGDEPGDRPEHRDPVVAAASTRAPAAGPGRVRREPGARPAIVSIRTPSGRSTSFTALEPVRLLHAQLPRAAHDALAAGHPGDEREERQLVDQKRHLFRRRLPSRSALRARPRCRRPAPRRRSPVEDGDPRAHALEHGEEAGARRVDPDPVDDAAREPGEERGRRDEGRGGGEVPGNLDVERLEPSARPDGSRGADARTRAPAASRRRSVWSRVGYGSTTTVGPSAA